MTGTSRLLLRLARWTAGPQRKEWLDAMAAEAATAGERSTGWALGCLWASMKDRAIREERFFLAILLLPIGVYLLEFLIFFPLVWLSRLLGLPTWTFTIVQLLLPLPFAFTVARRTQLRRALLVAALSWFILDALGVVTFWIMFGQGPGIWFEKGSQIYNMTPVLGWTCSLAVWLTGAWLGTLVRPSTSRGSPGKLSA